MLVCMFLAFACCASDRDGIGQPFLNSTVPLRTATAVHELFCTCFLPSRRLVAVLLPRATFAGTSASGSDIVRNHNIISNIIIWIAQRRSDTSINSFSFFAKMAIEIIFLIRIFCVYFFVRRFLLPFVSDSRSGRDGCFSYFAKGKILYAHEDGFSFHFFKVFGVLFRVVYNAQ